MQWRVILWRGVLLLAIGCLAVVLVRVLSGPPAPVVAQPPEKQAEAPPPPAVKALAPVGYISQLGYLAGGRKTTIIGGTAAGVRVYELEQYQGKYAVTDATQKPKGAEKPR